MDEKKYNEMVRRCKELHESGNALTKKQMEIVCPELAESEDERIRKELIDQVGDIVPEVNETDEDGRLLPCYYERIARYRAWLEKQKENPKSADSIPSDCVSDAKCEDRWHKVADFLPDNPREVLCKDEAGNYFIGRYYVGEGWEISNYDDEDKPHHLNPPVSKWIDFPSKKQKEQKPIKWTDLTWKDIVELEGIINNVHYEFRNGIGEESFGEEVLEKFREYKGDEYLDEKEQKSLTTEEIELNSIAFLEQLGYTSLKEEELKKIRESERVDGYLKGVRTVLDYPERYELVKENHLTKEEEYILNRIIEYLEDNDCPSEWKNLLLGIHNLSYVKQKEQKPAAEEILAKAGLKPYKDGNQWCILAGDNIQEGICGFGDTIDEALYEFLKEVLIMANSPQLKEQKPAEWSEEDEKMFVSVLHFLNTNRINERGKVITWVESLPKRFSLQPKQEWSEEDASGTIVYPKQHKTNMTQEEKQLLLKDLCARLPYQPTCEFTDTEYDFCTATVALGYSLRDFIAGKILIKPYLRPMSSMTEEERNNLRAYCRTQEGIIYDIGVSGAINSPAIIDWLNKNMFDYRGLIEKGLAIEAPEDMYKTE